MKKISSAEVGLLFTTMGMLSNFWTDNRVITYSLLIIGLILCLIAVLRKLKK